MAEKRKALIIANFLYEDADIRQLIAPHNDAESLARVLKDAAIGGFEVLMQLNEPSYKVAQAIEAFFANSGRDDLLLLYFSGHGMKDEDGQLYFATSNTNRKLLRSTAVSSKFVNEIMRMSRSRKQVVLLDCCYSGAFARGMLAKGDGSIGIKEEFEGRGKVILTASDAMQYSFEGNKVDGKGIRSIFTNKLVHGLESGEADLDGDGFISLDELYDYVEDSVCSEMPQQRPMKFALDVQGNIIIGRNPSSIVKPAKLPAELQQSIESPFARIREGSVNELSCLLRGDHRGLVLAAQLALKKLSEDDSRKVSTAAAKVLETFDPSQSFDLKLDTEMKIIPTCEDNYYIKRPSTCDQAKMPIISGFEKEFTECPQCKVKLTANARFCPECGGSLIEPQAIITQEKCQKCGSPMIPGALFCGKCGQGLSRRTEDIDKSILGGLACSNCQAIVPVGARFCGNCGKSL